MSANDRQEGGSHYRKHGGEQHWDRWVRLCGLDTMWVYFAATATAYIERYRFKYEGKPDEVSERIKDLKKARHYIDKLIELEEYAQYAHNVSEIVWHYRDPNTQVVLCGRDNDNAGYTDDVKRVNCHFCVDKLNRRFHPLVGDESDIQEMYRDPDRPTGVSKGWVQAHTALIDEDPPRFDGPPVLTKEQAEELNKKIRADFGVREKAEETGTDEVWHYGEGSSICGVEDYEVGDHKLTKDETKLNCSKCVWIYGLNKIQRMYHGRQDDLEGSSEEKVNETTEKKDGDQLRQGEGD
jgi:hypothetical protein